MSDPAFFVEKDDDAGKFRVVNDDGRTICVCGDRESADQYALLLNEAYVRGYRQGRRDLRNGVNRMD